MSVTSMTGFARTEGRRGSVAWHWEVRTVNGRGLDVRLRLAPGHEALDPAVREIAARAFVRGNVTIGLVVRNEAGSTKVRLNEAVLADVLAAARRLTEITGGTMPSAEALLGIRGVLEVVEAEPLQAETEATAAAMLSSLENACQGARAARSAEGARLTQTLATQLGEIERLTHEVAASPSRSAEVIRARLREQIGRLLDVGQGFDEARLHQEAVLAATRADVAEELQRLGSHITAAREMIAECGAVGRRLDFLAQEFNREANTLCSKSNAPDVTRAGLALKAVIDQLREQVQNIE